LKPVPDVLISGVSATKTIIDPDGRSRAFEVATDAVLSLTNLRVTGGQAGNGGALYMQVGGCLVANRVTIDHNGSSGEGGAVDSHSGDVVIRNSAIVQNSAAGDGGGILAEAETTGPPQAVPSAIVNTTIAKNRSGGDGGGVFDDGFWLRILSSTIADDEARGPGKALAYLNGSSSPVLFEDTLVNGTCSGPTTGSGFGAIVSEGHNLESTTTCGFRASGDMESTSPHLGIFGLNGGTTPTWQLLASSPAVNAGDGFDCPPVDQRGLARIGACDIGAFEFGR
jgi:hypothetical protein